MAESAVIESSDLDLVAGSGYFDAAYYLKYNADVARAGVDPLLHFMSHGYREGRNPSARFDLQYYTLRHVDAFTGDNMNPLVHFLRSGEPSSSVVPAVSPQGPSMTDVLKYYRAPRISRYASLDAWPGGSIAVVAHLYYTDRLDEFLSYLKNIPARFSLYITVVDGDAGEIHDRSVAALDRCDMCRVVACRNAGRDIGPFCVEFARIVAGYDYVCKIHTKSDVAGIGWPSICLRNLLGSPQVVSTIFSAFAGDRRLGLVYPTPPVVVSRAIARHGCWGDNRDLAHQFCDSIGVKFPDSGEFEFPAGSMFWARTASLAPLLLHRYAYSDFEGLSMRDGSLAHAIERLFGVVPESLGYSVEDICLLPPTPAKQPEPYKPIADPLLLARIREYQRSRGRRNRIAVYTASVGGHDKIKIPEELDADVDYYCFSDRKLEGPSPWHFLPIDRHDSSPVRVARFYKLHPFLYFSTYDYVIWVDATLLVRRSVKWMVDIFKEGNNPVAISPHPERNCTYEEMAVCRKRRLDDPVLIDAQAHRYEASGLPANLGLPETNVYVTSPADPLAWRVFADWWREVEDGSFRDQLSIMYVLWRNGAHFTPLARVWEDTPRFNRVKSDEARLWYFSHDELTTYVFPDVYRHPQFIREVSPVPSDSVGYASLYGRLQRHGVPRVTVVIAVHDALPDVKRCLESVDASDGRFARVVLVDDGSGEECARFLESYAAGHDNVRIIRHGEPAGYTSSINEAVRSSPFSDYYVFLNSDTVVPKSWPSKLVRAAESSPQIGVVGPLSNAATWQTVPVLLDGKSHCVNALPDGVDVDGMDMICERLAPAGLYPKTQLVNGFCYVVKRAVFDRIGLFDESNFSPGYAEEDDLSLRAVDAGFVLAIAPDTYVFHSKSRSFGRAARDRLAEEHLKLLFARHMRHRVHRECRGLLENPVLAAMRAGIARELNFISTGTSGRDCAILSQVPVISDNENNNKIERSFKMAVQADLVKRIMGSPGSVTAQLVSLRRTPGDGQLETGVWYSNFTRVKTEAESRGLPFFAMWTNGDLCGLCRRFTANIIAPEFISYMRSSGGLWWLGGSMDDNDEDRRGGVGFRWCTAPDQHVNYFPFMAVSYVNGGKRVEFFASGGDYDSGRQPPTGTALALRKMKEFVPGKSGAKPAVKPASVPSASQVKANTALHIRFNQDWDAAHILRFQTALRENGGHCLCQAKSPDTMCMCKSFLEQDKPGPCHCGAFEKFTV